MVSQISLGSFGTQNGKNVLTGSASQLDTKTIIDGLVTAKRAPAVRLESAVKTIDSKTQAFTDLKSILSKLQSSSDTLRNPPGVNVASKNIFEYRTASLTSSTGATATNYVDFAVQPGAIAQTHTIDSITFLAYQTKQQSGNFTLANSTTASAVTANGSPTPGLFRAGTVNLRAVDGTVGGIPLTLAEGDSLQTVANKFNELSSRTGIQASVLTVADGTYKLIFSATKTGTTYGFDLALTSPAAHAGIESDPSSVFGSLAAITTTQPAQNAEFSLDGVTISRESNSVSDVLDNVTISLKQLTGVAAGTITASIIPDTSLVSNAITQFADAYNEFRLFVSNQTQLNDDGTPKDTSILYDDSIFRQIIDNISSEVSHLVSGVTDGNPEVLLDVGISLDNFQGDDKNPATKNIMTVDTDKLNAMLLSNFDGVRQLFEYSQTSDDSNFVTFKRSNNLTVTDLTFSIDRTGDVYTATYTDPSDNSTQIINLDATEISGGGVGLKGQVGTILEGAQFVYASSATTATIHVSLSQGYGDRFYNMVDGLLNSTDGLITTQLTTLADTKQRNEEEITAIDDRLVTYRETLLLQYSQLEAALTKANQLLQLLDAQTNARNNG